MDVNVMVHETVCVVFPAKFPNLYFPVSTLVYLSLIKDTKPHEFKTVEAPDFVKLSCICVWKIIKFENKSLIF